MNKKFLLILAGLLVAIGLLKPSIPSSLVNIFKPSAVVVDNQTIDEPSDPVLKEKCADVISALRTSSSRSKDGPRLGNLYADLATLIELEGENTVVKTTDEIRQANMLSGTMLRMNIKGEYSNLAVATNGVIVAGIGLDNVILNTELRAKAVESFRALAWACYEGAK